MPSAGLFWRLRKLKIHVWGRGGTPGYVRSWRATANGLEGAAASATDTCLVLDELGVGEARDVAASVYTLANGVGKARAARDGSSREPRCWRVFVLSSGESPVETKLGRANKTCPEAAKPRSSPTRSATPST
jgi:putative DNA primase/helicase